MAKNAVKKRWPAGLMVVMWCMSGGLIGFVLGGIGTVIVDWGRGRYAGSMGVNPLIWILPLALTIAGLIIGGFIGAVRVRTREDQAAVNAKQGKSSTH
jgi:hypothetical protein